MKKVKYWKTKDGEEIPIKELTDSHILNIMNYFEKNFEVYRQRWLSKAYMFMDSLNGECAKYYCENMIDLVESENPEFDPEGFLEETVEGYREIKQEARKRKLIEH